MVRGGNEFDGREIAPLDEKALHDIAKEIKKKKITAAAISSVFSPVTADMERRAAAIIANEAAGYPPVAFARDRPYRLSRARERDDYERLPGRSGSSRLCRRSAVHWANLKIKAPFFISQNDGTLMVPEHVERYPVLTFASGPTNSMRGAALLAGLKEAMVVDIGGTTSDVGMLIHGFPREAAVSVDIGGVRTNFRMPDVLADRVWAAEAWCAMMAPGSAPTSVGYELTTKALVFGGDILTTTDIVVAAGLQDIGDRSRVKHLTKKTIDTALDTIHRMADAAVDRMKTSAEPMPVVLVGGGAILISRPLPSASRVIHPPHSSVANAIGAAVAQVGGEVDRVFAVEGTTREAVLDIAKQEATDRAIAAGADSQVSQDRRYRGRAARLSARQCHPNPGEGGRRSVDDVTGRGKGTGACGR